MLVLLKKIKIYKKKKKKNKKTSSNNKSVINYTSKNAFKAKRHKTVETKYAKKCLKIML